jgi:hypothetical protein
MQAALAPINLVTWHHIPGYNNLYSQCLENITPHVLGLILIQKTDIFCAFPQSIYENSFLVPEKAPLMFLFLSQNMRA